MKTRDYALGAIAGFALFALWYVQIFLSWRNVNFTLLCYIYPLISAVFLVTLLKHAQPKYALMKTGVHLLAFFIYAAMATSQNLLGVLLALAQTGHGELSAGNSFAVALLTICFFAINGIAVLAMLAHALWKKKKQASTL